MSIKTLAVYQAPTLTSVRASDPSTEAMSLILTQDPISALEGALMLARENKARQDMMKKLLTGDHLIVKTVADKVTDILGIKLSSCDINSLLIEMGYQNRERIGKNLSYSLTSFSADHLLGVQFNTSTKSKQSSIRWDACVIDLICNYYIDYKVTGNEPTIN